MRNNISGTRSASRKKREKFCSTRGHALWDKQGSFTNSESENIRHQPMKTLLTVCLCSVSLALTSFGQNPPPAPPAQAASATPRSPPCLAWHAARHQLPAACRAAVPGMSPAPGSRHRLRLRRRPACRRWQAPPVAVTSCSAIGNASGLLDNSKVTGNFFIDNFRKGGPIMWPILIVSIIASDGGDRAHLLVGAAGSAAIRNGSRKFSPRSKIGDVAEASRLSRDSRDPVLRMMWNGLNHQHASLQGALQVAAGIEIKRAGRFLVVMDTLVTLAPLLGLLGTITGLMHRSAFSATKSSPCRRSPAVSRKR